ncbi:TIGR03085 family metal-binding protein [Mycobacterium sp. NPDC050441]|uniref:TIGR03085 family metal-binding protein n=1 Tax=Mycobacterium sp. NPDC050441 TaxID=3155403 RepID=UPI003409DBB4
MQALSFDMQERLALCDLLDQLGADAPTLLGAWVARDLAAHIVVRERDPIAGPCLVMHGALERFAERRRVRMVEDRDFGWLVSRIRCGPPPGLFRIEWVRSLANLNEFFVHHEDLRRANGLGPRDILPPDLEAALWRNVRRGSRYLSRRLRGAGLEIVWAGTEERVTVRKAEPSVRLSGRPGELLLYIFGRQAAAQVEVRGPAQAVAAVRNTHFGM